MDSQLFADKHFKQFIDTLNLKGITQFDYFVNWGKVFKNITPIEKELNLLNTAIGKEDIEAALFDILKTYPKTIKTVPTLLAMRDKSVEVLIDSMAFIYKNFDFNLKEVTDEKINDVVNLLVESGFAELIKTKQIKSIPDYCIGVEV